MGEIGELSEIAQFIAYKNSTYVAFTDNNDINMLLEIADVVLYALRMAYLFDYTEPLIQSLMTEHNDSNNDLFLLSFLLYSLFFW